MGRYILAVSYSLLFSLWPVVPLSTQLLELVAYFTDMAIFSLETP